MDPLEVIELAIGCFAVSGLGQYQSHDPDLSGFVPMNMARAEEVAAAIAALLTQDGTLPAQ
jgi:hypothetical protein